LVFVLVIEPQTFADGAALTLALFMPSVGEGVSALVCG